MNCIKWIKLYISSEIELLADYTFVKVLVLVSSWVLEVSASVSSWDEI